MLNRGYTGDNFRRAVALNDIEFVRNCIVNCPELINDVALTPVPNEIYDYVGKSALHLAAQYGHAEIVEILLNNGALINLPVHYCAIKNRPKNDINTALRLAVLNKHPDVIKVLIKHGAESLQVGFNKINSENILFDGVRSRNVEVLKALLAAKSLNVNQKRSSDKATPLTIAAECGYTEIVSALLEAGADVNVQWSPPHSQNRSPLQAAINNKSIATIILLLAAPNIKIPDDLTNELKQLIFDEIMKIKNKYERKKALLNAIGEGPQGHAHPLCKIMDDGGVVTASNLFSGPNGLLLGPTGAYKYFGIFGKIREAIADIEKGEYQKRPRFYANINLWQYAQSNDLAGMQDYFEHYGRNPDSLEVLDANNRSALYFAAQCGHIEMVRFLLANGVKVNQTLSPLVAAIEGGHVDVVNELLAHDADALNVKSSGQTPVYIATKLNRLDIVKVLANDASVNQRSDNKLPLHLAALNGNLDIVDALLAAGANPNANESDRLASNYKYTAIDAAIIGGRLLVIKRLLTLQYIDIHENVSVSKEIKQSLLEDILKIPDEYQRRIALLDATGKGERGNDHPIYKALKSARYFSSSDTTGTLGEANRELDELDKRIKNREAAEKNAPVNVQAVKAVESTQASVKVESSSAMTMRALTPSSWKAQFADFKAIETYLKRDRAEVLAQLDQVDQENVALRDYFLNEAKTKPFILYMMIMLGDESVHLKSGMQKILWDWMQHKDLPFAIRNMLLTNVKDLSSPLYRYLSQDPEVLVELSSVRKEAAIDVVQLARVTQTQATLYPALSQQPAPVAVSSEPSPPVVGDAPPSYDEALKQQQLLARLPSVPGAAPVRTAAAVSTTATKKPENHQRVLA